MAGTIFDMEISPQKKAKATADLLEHMRTMLNNPEFSDVLFKCRDGVQVCASRMLIIGRSPVLSSIVSRNKTRETRQAEFSLPYITSEALLAVLEFLYTGTVLEHAPRTLAQAHQVFNAACHFQFPQVVEMVGEFLMNSTADVEDDASKAALRLSVALECDGPLSAELSSFVRVLESVELGFAQLSYLSEKAFRYFLERTQHKSDVVAISCFEEYVRFRQVLLWCAVQIVPKIATEIIDGSVINLRSAQRLVQNSSAQRGSTCMEPQTSFASQSVKKLNLFAELPDLAARANIFFGLVDFRRIHAELLDEVVAPLKIVPEAQLMEAFRSQALLRNAPRSEHGNFRWEHDNSYRTEGDGTVLVKHTDKVGFARFCAPITAAYMVYEWDIILEQVGGVYFEIGLYVAQDLEPGWSPQFTGKLEQQLESRVLRHTFMGGAEINQYIGSDVCWTKFGKNFAYEDAKVTVRLDLWERCCSFSVDGDSFLEAWANLPEGVYYPAVSLGEIDGNRVRIKLVNGFHMV